MSVPPLSLSLSLSPLSLSLSLLSSPSLSLSLHVPLSLNLSFPFSFTLSHFLFLYSWTYALSLPYPIPLSFSPLSYSSLNYRTSYPGIIVRKTSRSSMRITWMVRKLDVWTRLVVSEGAKRTTTPSRTTLVTIGHLRMTIGHLKLTKKIDMFLLSCNIWNQTMMQWSLLELC